METTLFGIIHHTVIGVGLAAACGFRVFVPLLVMSVAARAGQLELAEGCQWIASWPALITFSVATVTEIIAFYIPWVANLLDTMATPAAVVAGTLAAAAQISETSPLLQWSMAIIAGGGIAAAVQATTVIARAASTITTGGLGDWIVASLELMISFVMAVLAVVVPILGAVVVCGVGIWVVRRFLRRRATKAAAGVVGNSPGAAA